MKTQIPFKLKLIIPLLITAIIIQAFALFTLTNIDNIVHINLYQHGLQFDYAWARLYWDHFRLFSTSLTIATILMVISIASIIGYIKNNRASLKFAGYTPLLMATSLNIFSVYIFTRIDYIINDTLYNFGLQFSFEWATPYYTYVPLLLASVGIASAITLTASLLIHFSTQKKIIKEKLVKKIRTEEPEIVPVRAEDLKLTKIRTKTTRARPVKLASSILITTGTAGLLMSIFYVSSILAFIGLGLLFWGILFTYIRTEEYTKKALLNTVAYPQIDTLNQVIQELNFEGNPIYLPPKYFKNPETHKAYISKQNETVIPTPEQIQKEETQLFTKNPPGILMTPPGSELTRLFEKTLGTNFARVDLQYLQQNLPKLLIEDLEITQNFEMETENNKVHIKIENLYGRIESENEQHQFPLMSVLSSAIACALAKTTGNPIIMEKQQTSQDGKDVTIEYRIINEEAQTKP